MNMIPLPYLTHLGETITKKVTFNVKRSKANNRYTQSIGIGLASNIAVLDLTYISLTESQLTTLETLFNNQVLDSFISYKPPTKSVISLYRYPTSWKVDKKVLSGNVTRYWVSFQLLQYSEL